VRVLGVSRRETADQVILSGRCKIRWAGSDELVIKYPNEYQALIPSEDASPFAAALLLPSMKRGENLIIEGKVSARLYAGMKEIIKVVSGWNIGLKAIDIEVAELSSDEANPSITATFFSGGVDSFYTHLTHVTDRESPLSHFLLVNGYDIDLRNKALWAETVRSVRAIAAEEQVALIEIESNMRTLLDPILPWGYSHGGCLAAVALGLRNGIGQIYVPSSYDMAHHFPWGSHRDVDHFWSTENLTFIHDGSEATRLDKVRWQIAQSPTALKHLRVCYINEKGTYNCGKCDKCIRTMISLYIAGTLDKAVTFPNAIDPDRVAHLVIEGDHGALFHRENLAALQALSLAPELQEALRTSLSNVTEESTPVLGHLLPYIVHLDHVYARGILRSLASLALGKKF
jgi:hypothetical protein